MAAPSILFPFVPRTASNPFLRDLHSQIAKRARGGGRTVAQAFDELFEAIEITDAERKKASKQQKSVRENLDAELTLTASYLSGSYRRYTLIRPLDDIDLLLVLDWSTYKETLTLDGEGAKNALDLVQAALREVYPKSELKRWGRCIQIQFAGTGIGFDVVPALKLTDNEFYIPDTDLGRWVRTNPKEVERLVSEANAKTDGWLVPLVKLLKAWKDAHKAPIRGYHLEALAYHYLTAAPTNARVGIADLFDALAPVVTLTTPDIWPQGESPSEHLSVADARTVSTMLSQAAADARAATAAEDRGDVDDAHAFWRKLFGDRYPEQGTTIEAKKLSYTDAVKSISNGAFIGATSQGLTAPASTRVSVRAGTSHGGIADVAVSREPRSITGDAADSGPIDDASGVDVDGRSHAVHLEWQIALTLEQFPALTRMTPAEAAADDALWPVSAKDVPYLYAVLVGEQGVGLGPARRILVTVPADMPATEPRVYRLDRAALRGTRPDGRRASTRQRQHQWNDGAMCSHARRDRWDGRLVTILVYAVDWLFRQELYARTGTWIGYELDVDGRLLRSGTPLNAAHRPSRPSRPSRGVAGRG